SISGMAGEGCPRCIASLFRSESRVNSQKSTSFCAKKHGSNRTPGAGAYRGHRTFFFLAVG
ncbi:hypothetical protein, partial [Ralstonia solanacearum]|uniref:hypothetical protein n=1 Tax=Ralstonia solanacearum TaxID=305 RepID=UPI001E60B588